jgi:hypothetical protein
MPCASLARATHDAAALLLLARRHTAPALAPPPFLPLTGMAATAILGRAGALGSPGPEAAFLSSSVIAACPGPPTSRASAPHPHAASASCAAWSHAEPPCAAPAAPAWSRACAARPRSARSPEPGPPAAAARRPPLRPYARARARRSAAACFRLPLCRAGWRRERERGTKRRERDAHSRSLTPAHAERRR